MLVKALRILRQAGILNLANRTLLESHKNPVALAFSLSRLAQFSLLTPEYQALVLGSSDPYISDAIITLSQASLLTPEYQAMVMSEDHPQSMAEVLKYLSQAGILTKELISFFQSIKDTWLITKPCIAKALLKLQQNSLLTEENKALFFAHPHHYDLTQGVIELDDVGLLSQENLTVLFQAIDKDQANSIGKTLAYVKRSGILNESFRQRIITSQNIYFLVGPVQNLSIMKRLSERLLDKLLSHPYPDFLMTALKSPAIDAYLYEENLDLADEFARLDKKDGALFCLSRAGILNKENEASLLSRSKLKKFSKALFVLLRNGLLTQDNFNYLLTKLDVDTYSSLTQYDWGNVLTQENMSIVMEHPHAHPLGGMFAGLEKYKLLTPANRLALLEYSGDMKALSEGVYELKSHETLTQEHFNCLLAHPNLKSKDLAYSLSVMSKSGILTPENLTLVLGQENQKLLADSLWELFTGKYLTNETFHLLLASSDLNKLHKILFMLQEEKINTIENFTAVVTKNIDHLLFLIGILFDNGILTQDNMNKILESMENILFFNTIIWTANVKLLSQENFNLLVAKREKVEFGYAVMGLEASKLLTQERLLLIGSSVGTVHFLQALFTLFDNKILSEESYNFLVRYPDLCMVMLLLHHRKILTLENFMVFFDPRNSIMLHRKMYELIWLPYAKSKHLTQENFDGLVRAARQTQPVIALIQERDDKLIDILPTAWASVQRLLLRYGRDFDLPREIAAMQWINRLEDSVRNNRAKVSIQRLMAEDFVISQSGVRISLRQVIALVHRALHDEVHRLGSFEHARACFIDVLARVQQGDDIGGCYGLKPTFNEILKQCSWLHVDMEAYSIDQAGARQKFSRVVMAEASKYLSSICSPRLGSEFLQVRKLLNDIKDSGNIALIWPMINTKVVARIWDEFQTLYANQDALAFQALIAEGPSLMLADLSKFQQVLFRSQGHHQHQDAQHLLFFATTECPARESKRCRIFQ